MLSGMRTNFDRDFDTISQDLVAMGTRVENALEEAVLALSKRDIPRAKAIIAKDTEINALRFKIEEACIALIATQQPTAGDLRAVIAVMHIVLEIERMGDHCAGIAKTVILMKEEPLLKTLKKIPKMGTLSQQMLNDCIQAFLKRDTNWAREIAARDAELDKLYRAVFNRLVKIMAESPELVTRATYLLWCAHNLERIADRVTNIAEQIVFMRTGSMGELGH